MLFAKGITIVGRPVRATGIISIDAGRPVRATGIRLFAGGELTQIKYTQCSDAATHQTGNIAVVHAAPTTSCSSACGSRDGIAGGARGAWQCQD